MEFEISYKSDHHFNKKTLVHVYRGSDLISRKWISRDNRIVDQYDYDRSITLKQCEGDIINCFCYTGVLCSCPSYPDCDHISKKVLEEILDTPMPSIKCVRRVFNQEWDELLAGDESERIKMTRTESIVPKTYYELFSIIGYHYSKMINGDRKIYEYPDSVGLSLEVHGEVLYYGYYR